MKTFQKTPAFIALFFLVTLFSCSKDKDTPTDVKTFFIGDWSGNVLYDGSTDLYPFDLIIYSDATLKNIDIAFSSQEFPGSYTYTNDSLKINYNNGTKWKLKFSNNYTSCSGSVLGYQGATGTINMSKN